MLEFKRDAESGQAYLLEINARPWGSIALALAVGVDFVGAWTRPEQFEGTQVEYPEDVRLRWWWGDVDHFYLRAKEAGRSGAGALVGAFFKACAAGPRAEAWDTFRRDDPLPFAGETLAWLVQGS
jgi:predicted ATP-grasp superfamily ATP-dependent carboligase